jgi:pyruvate-formate lyase-activating enzyme
LKNVSSVDVLPYHQAAKAKYRKLGTDYPGDTIPALANSTLEQTVVMLKQHGLQAVVGG